jgi:diguanylate cyclase (GGDEF)-like protein
MHGTLAPDRSRAPDWLGPLALLVASALAAWVSVRYTRFGGVASLWVANGLLAGALQLTPKRRWPSYLVAAFIGQATARALVGDGWPMSVALSVINLAECGIVAGWVRRNLDDLAQARSLGLVARDAIGSTLAACALSATLALPILLQRAGVTPVYAWLTWFASHVLGMVFVATLVVCLFQARMHLRGNRREALSLALCIGLLLLACWLCFAQSAYPLLFLPWLPLMLLAWRHGLAGVVIGMALLALLSGAAATADLGPFEMMVNASPQIVLLFWQGYLAASALLAFASAVALTQSRQLERRLQRSQARMVAAQAQLQAITEHLPAMVARFDREARYVYANDRSRRMAAGVELVGKSLLELRGGTQYAQLQPNIEAVLRGESPTFDTYLQLPDQLVELRAQFVPDRAPDGSVQGFYSLSFDISEAKRNERELEQLARFDALTGLANRRHFEESLAEAVARAMRTGGALMLLSLDLDKFKDVNDTLGHAAGDEVLKEFGRRVRASVFDVDLVSRLGGDEFVVLVEYSASAESGERMAQHIIEAMRPPIDLPTGEAVQVATSIGIGLQQPVASAESLLAAADRALYEAKARGRNTWAIEA